MSIYTICCDRTESNAIKLRKIQLKFDEANDNHNNEFIYIQTSNSIGQFSDFSEYLLLKQLPSNKSMFKIYRPQVFNK